MVLSFLQRLRFFLRHKPFTDMPLGFKIKPSNKVELILLNFTLAKAKETVNDFKTPFKKGLIHRLYILKR